MYDRVQIKGTECEQNVSNNNLLKNCIWSMLPYLSLWHEFYFCTIVHLHECHIYAVLLYSYVRLATNIDLRHK
jgi:hypothetical protein